MASNIAKDIAMRINTKAYISQDGILVRLYNSLYIFVEQMLSHYQPIYLDLYIVNVFLGLTEEEKALQIKFATSYHQGNIWWPAKQVTFVAFNLNANAYLMETQQ